MSKEVGCFIREGIGEQPVRTGFVEGSDEDLDTATGATPEQIERDALILKLTKLIVENAMEQNPSNEALTRVIDGCLPAIFSAINEIILEQEPRVTSPATVQVNIEESFVSQK